MSQHPRPGWYTRRILPHLIDFACNVRSVRQQRQKVVPLARGRVLEIGIGTGRNLEHYDRARVEVVIGLDPEVHRLARERAERAGVPVEWHERSAERILFPDGSFDTVLSTYSLCTIPDPGAALREIRRVLRPAGVFIFCEHGLSPNASVRRWQHWLTPFWSRVTGGCHLNRDIPALLRDAGLVSSDLQTLKLPGPSPLTYNAWGTAVAGRRE
jgi:ubiquinone/menaquinone biosynthesis C-methylase UbiE